MSLETYLTASRTLPRLKHIFSILYDIRYATFGLLKSVKSPATTHICTAPSFAKLKELKHLAEPKPGVFALDTRGCNLIEKKPYTLNGGGEHDLQVARHVLQAITVEGASVMYPRFERQGLIPDALLVYREDGKYRLEFLEVELSPKEKTYLSDKLKKYDALAKDQTLYTDWWQAHRERLGLPFCTLDQFCFGVRVV